MYVNYKKKRFGNYLIGKERGNFYVVLMLILGADFYWIEIVFCVKWHAVMIVASRFVLPY